MTAAPPLLPRGRRALSLMGHVALGTVIVVTGVALAKIAQYAAVDQLGARLGFDLASAVGVVPVIALYLWLAHRFPQMSWRRKARS